MKASVLITLIVCGTLLVMAPAVSDFVRNQQAVWLFAARQDLTNMNLNSGRMEDLMRIGFWFTGTMVLVCGIVGGFVSFFRETRRV